MLHQSVTSFVSMLHQSVTSFVIQAKTTESSC